MPKLKAAEALKAVSVHMVGACTMEQGDRKSLLRRWQNMIGKTDRRKLTRNQRDVMLMNMGIGIKRAKR